MDQARGQWPGNRFPPALTNVVEDLLGIAEEYCSRHAEEAARGWDALQLLRGIKPRLVAVLEQARIKGEAR